jgi:hypothetical protein
MSEREWGMSERIGEREIEREYIYIYIYMEIEIIPRETISVCLEISVWSANISEKRETLPIPLS